MKGVTRGGGVKQRSRSMRRSMRSSSLALFWTAANERNSTRFPPPNPKQLKTRKFQGNQPCLLTKTQDTCPLEATIGHPAPCHAVWPFITSWQRDQQRERDKKTWGPVNVPYYPLKAVDLSPSFVREQSIERRRRTACKCGFRMLVRGIQASNFLTSNLGVWRPWKEDITGSWIPIG